MIKIYLTRHSKTEWNQEKRLQGHCDSPLTQEGIENAKALKNYLKQLDLHFDAIYSSPIKRAYHTAYILFPDEYIIQDIRLMEMNFGDFEGRKIEDILKDDKELYDNLWNHPEKFTRIPNGESYNGVIVRAQSFLAELENLPQGSTVMIVTHGMFFIVLLACMLGLDKKDWIQINQKVVEGCSLTFVEYENKFVLKDYNLCHFLPYISQISFKN